jgi:peroxiredoxin Q/BCP
MHLKPGDVAPDFSAVATDGSTVRLADFRGRTLVLYFYPMDDTPGCTRQACSLRDGHAAIAATGAAIVGVSAQDRASHERFAEKYRLDFPLLADADQHIARAYGTVGGLLGPVQGLFGIGRRVTFIIDGEGRIRHVIDDVDTAAHAEQVLKLLAR